MGRRISYEAVYYIDFYTFASSPGFPTGCRGVNGPMYMYSTFVLYFTYLDALELCLHTCTLQKSTVPATLGAYQGDHNHNRILQLCLLAPLFQSGCNQTTSFRVTVAVYRLVDSSVIAPCPLVIPRNRAMLLPPLTTVLPWRPD